MPLRTTYVDGDTGAGRVFAADMNGISTQVNANIQRSIVSVTTTVTLGSIASTDYVALIGAGGAPTLPTAVGNTNLYTCKNIDTTNKTVATTSSQTIDGSATAVLTPNTSVDVISDGSNWRIV